MHDMLCILCQTYAKQVFAVRVLFAASMGTLAQISSPTLQHQALCIHAGALGHSLLPCFGLVGSSWCAWSLLALGGGAI